MSLTKEDVQVLSAPFDDQTLGVKVQSLSKARDKAMLILYLQHTDVAARLDSVDPAWSSEITDQRETGSGESFFVTTRMRITLKGSVREGVGEGQDPKSAASDALKRTAMLFGVGRYLYDSTGVWVPYNEQIDKYRSWTYADYKSSLRPGPLSGQASPSQSHASPSVQGLPKPKAARTRMEVGSAITSVAKRISLNTKDMGEWVFERFGKQMSQLTLPEMEDFLGVLEAEEASRKEGA